MKEENSTTVDHAVIVILCLSGLRFLSCKKVHKAFWTMSNNENFKNILSDLDFDCRNGQYYSPKLEKILLMFGTAGILHYSNPRYSDYYVPEESTKFAEKILTSRSATDQRLLNRALLVFKQLMKE
jgi:hypothetical protein